MLAKEIRFFVRRRAVRQAKTCFCEDSAPFVEVKEYLAGSCTQIRVLHPEGILEIHADHKGKALARGLNKGQNASRRKKGFDLPQPCKDIDAIMEYVCAYDEIK